MNEKVKNILGVLLFYLIIVGGVIALNYRYGQLNKQKSAEVVKTQQHEN